LPACRSSARGSGARGDGGGRGGARQRRRRAAAAARGSDGVLVSIGEGATFSVK
jgi:hypothetical protein